MILTKPLLLLFIIIFNFGCKTMELAYKTKAFNITPYQVHNITLSEHQVKPVEYLFRNSEQKGLIINHYLGTGKTFTALAFGERFPDNNILILAPEFLESNWRSHMQKMGIKNIERYEFMSYQKAESALKNRDLSKTILIVDEVHRLVEKIKSGDEKHRAGYSLVYSQLRKAYKIMLLTGTPVFTEISDIAYSINLVSGQDLLPYNDRLFMDEFTSINKTKSFWRGHFSESHILMFGAPFVLASIPLAFIIPTTGLVAGLYFGGLGAGFAILPTINALNPLEKSPMRNFNPGRIKELAMQYVSYYDFRNKDNEDYPTQSVIDNSVNYNHQQAQFMLDFADLALDENQLKLLAREKNYNLQGNLKIESTPLQAKLRDWPDSGREIGNLDFTNEEGQIIESPKFEKVYQSMGDNPQSVVIYSSYYENGALAFAKFLDRKGMKDKYEILNPDTTIDAQTATVNRFNAGKLPILILHPVYTEGLSLEGTQQLHILEPLPSQALNEQVMGRTIRYKSHAHLAKEKRHVNIYTWKSTLGFTEGILGRNENWAKRFAELNSISSFGVGQSRIDKNFDRKKMSPDDFSDLKRSSLKEAMTALETVFKKYSIEGNINVF